MLTLSRDDFLKWYAFRIGQKLVNDSIFRDEIRALLVNLGSNNIFNLEAENRIPFIWYVENNLMEK